MLTPLIADSVARFLNADVRNLIVLHPVILCFFLFLTLVILGSILPQILAHLLHLACLEESLRKEVRLKISKLTGLSSASFLSITCNDEAIFS